MVIVEPFSLINQDIIRCEVEKRFARSVSDMKRVDFFMVRLEMLLVVIEP
jgi:hypothetical protein